MSEVQEIFEGLVHDFVPEAAGDWKACVQFNISGDGGGKWYVTVADGKLTVSEGTAPSPTSTMDCSADTWLDFYEGDLDLAEGKDKGLIKVSGNAEDLEYFEEDDVFQGELEEFVDEEGKPLPEVGEDEWDDQLEDAVTDMLAERLREELEPVEDEEELAALDEGKVEGAIERFITGDISLAELTGIDMETAYSIAQVAFNLMSQRDYEKSDTIFKGLIVLSPSDGYFHSLLATSYMRQEKWQEALDEYSAAIHCDSEDVASFCNRGEIYLRMGKVLECIQDLQRAFELDPKGEDPAIPRARAIALAAQDLLAEALGDEADELLAGGEGDEEEEG